MYLAERSRVTVLGVGKYEKKAPEGVYFRIYNWMNGESYNCDLEVERISKWSIKLITVNNSWFTRFFQLLPRVMIY